MSDSPQPVTEPDPIEAEADAAAARRDFTTARRLLAQVTAAAPERMEPWLKLAALCRAQGARDAALEAVFGALRVDPLAFVPLLLKATLMESLGRTREAGEGYGHALAQRPEPVPPHLRKMVEQAEARYAEHQATVDANLRAATAGLALEPREARRLDRFRSNLLRKTRPWHSDPTHFHYPGLRELEFHDREDFSWLGELEQAADAIRADLHRVMEAERAELVPYVQYPEHVPLRQWAALNKSRDWTAIHLVAQGRTVEANARHCPALMELLPRLGQRHVSLRSPNAMFSLLAPGAHIPPHTGVDNSRLVCHLPLIVPEGCWFRVGAETREWREGEAWVFDDTIEHEAMNPSDKLRVILIIDTWHPDLSPAERQAVTAMLEATQVDVQGEAL